MWERNWEHLYSNWAKYWFDYFSISFFKDQGFVKKFTNLNYFGNLIIQELNFEDNFEKKCRW